MNHNDCKYDFQELLRMHKDACLNRNTQGFENLPRVEKELYNAYVHSLSSAIGLLSMHVRYLGAIEGN
jgi:hypothetical protein